MFLLLYRKRWTLFSPEDSAYLYPKRLPFELTTIWSKINFKSINLEQFSNFSKATPRVIELHPGDVLFVPRHWWHFVENIPDQEIPFTISVNHWIFDAKNAEETFLCDSFDESLANFVMNLMVNTFPDSDSFLNDPGSFESIDDTMNAINALYSRIKQVKEDSSQESRTLKRSREDENEDFTKNCDKKSRIHLESQEKDSRTDKWETIPVNREYLKEFFVRKNLPETEKDKESLKVEDIVEAILKPEVLSLIRKNIFQQK